MADSVRIKVVNKDIPAGEWRVSIWPRGALGHQFDLVVEVLDPIRAGQVLEVPLIESDQ